MRGSTRKRGDTWTAYWDGPPDPRTGKRKQRSKGGFRTQKEAQRHLATVITQVSDGSYIEPSRQPLARFMLDEWLPAIRGTLRPLTHRRYESMRRSCVAKRDIGGVPLRALTGANMTALYLELEEEGLSVGTRRLVHAMLRKSLNDAVLWGKLARNPAGAADPPSPQGSRARSWSPRELRTFLESVADDRLFALWRLAATTGMRRGELLGLPWRCVDFECGRLRVEQQVLPNGGRAVLGAPKSRRSERTVALDPDTVEALRRHRDLQRLERDVAGPAYEEHDLVFPDELAGRSTRSGSANGS